MKILILSENDENSSNVIRCLGPVRHDYILAGQKKLNLRIKSSSLFSKFIPLAHSFVASDTSTQFILDDIIKAIKNENIDLIAASDYETLIFISTYVDILKTHCSVIPTPDVNLIHTLDDKAVCINFLSKHDILIPKTLIIDEPSDISEAIFEELGRPCIIKTSRGAGGEGVKIVSTLDDVHRFFKGAITQVFAQKLIDGIDYCFNAYAVKGNIKCWSLFRYVELDQRKSKGQFVQFIKDADIYAQGKKIINVSDYTGPIVIDFRKETHSEKIFFIEVNPRFGNNTNFSLLDGINFPQAGFELATDANYKAQPSGKGLWSCSLKRLFTAPLRKLDLFALAYIIKIGIPQWYSTKEQNRMLFQPTKNDKKTQGQR